MHAIIIIIYNKRTKLNSLNLNIPKGGALGRDLIPLEPGVLPPELVGVIDLGTGVVDFSFWKS